LYSINYKMWIVGSRDSVFPEFDHPPIVDNIAPTTAIVQCHNKGIVLYRRHVGGGLIYITYICELKHNKCNCV